MNVKTVDTYVNKIVLIFIKQQNMLHNQPINLTVDA